MSKAIEYILSNQKELIEFANHGNVPNPSQQSEQAIRPFILMREIGVNSMSVLRVLM